MGQVFAEITLKNAGDITLAEHGYKQEQEIRQTTVNILVDTGAEKSLLGLIPLEDMDLMVDPNGQEVISAHGYQAVGIGY